MANSGDRACARSDGPEPWGPPEGPLLVLVGGLVASGKSTLARALAARWDMALLEADRVRGTLLAAAEAESTGAEARWRRDLSSRFEAEIYDDLLRRADAMLAAGRSLVLDACFPRRAAARRGARFLFVECQAPEATVRARLAQRDRAAGHPGWERIYGRLADHFQATDHLPQNSRISVRGDGPTGPALDAIRQRLLAAPPPATASGGVFVPAPRAVSFDCWGTLIVEEDWPWAHSLRVMALRDAAREAGREVTRAEAERAFDAAWQRHMTLWVSGEATGAPEVARWSLTELGFEEAGSALEHLVRRFEEASHTSHVVALGGARALLAALDAADIPSVLVCDTGLTPGRVVRRLLERVGLLAHLRALAFSDEVGAPKPDQRPFLAALQPLGVAPEHALHVGDLRRTDVVGARALGMRTVRIRARNDDVSEDPDADRVVDSHDELAGLLGLRLG